jgi:hypothetical protein
MDTHGPVIQQTGGKVGETAKTTQDEKKTTAEADQKKTEENIKKAQALVKAELDALKKVHDTVLPKGKAAQTLAEANDKKCEEIEKRAHTTYGTFADPIIGPSVKSADAARAEIVAAGDEIQAQTTEATALIEKVGTVLDDPNKGGELKAAKDSIAKLIAMYERAPEKLVAMEKKSKDALSQLESAEKTLKAQFDAKAKASRDTVKTMHDSVKNEAEHAGGDPIALKKAITSAQETSRNIDGHVSEYDGFGGDEPGKVRVDLAKQKADVDLIIGDMEKQLKASEAKQGAK